MTQIQRKDLLGELYSMINFTLNLIHQFENHKNDTKYSDDDDFIDSILV